MYDLDAELEDDLRIDRADYPERPPRAECRYCEYARFLNADKVLCNYWRTVKYKDGYCCHYIELENDYDYE